MYAFESRVRYSECDETGRLSLASMVNYLQDASTFQSEELDRGFASLGERAIAWILAAWRIEVDELPRLGERVRVSTWCYDMSRSRALRCFSMTDAAGRDLVRADSKWFVYDVAAGHVAHVPDDQRIYLSDEPRARMAPLERSLRPAGEARAATRTAIRPHHLDTNRHVNNAQYVLFASDALAELGHAGAVSCVSVQYRRMALLGDVVVPRVSAWERGWDVDLADDAGSTYALVRFEMRREETR
ncbi:acyl-[acyl-carrier-protein] thioesterase [Olsenella uli]|uniref:acyl-[acyl-carrier-protein] thioesterase n=1 Tax=Olsenella uli TaxID=133926 RepID=UPI0019587D89|nr:acyl-ACP thioesterase domain-containing protein [Olsenella uli]MBM6675230.1 acyl-[acyl-carrier-protein] thioesterase [Olsenella uli]